MNKYRLLTVFALAGTFVPSIGQGMPSYREFSILESKVTPGHAEPSGEGPSPNADRIRWIRFEVKLTVLVYFDVASSLETKDLPYPADWHQWPWPV